jgi:hypothetical protein
VDFPWSIGLEDFPIGDQLKILFHFHPFLITKKRFFYFIFLKKILFTSSSSSLTNAGYVAAYSFSSNCSKVNVLKKNFF